MPRKDLPNVFHLGTCLGVPYRRSAHGGHTRVEQSPRLPQTRRRRRLRVLRRWARGGIRRWMSSSDRQRQWRNGSGKTGQRALRERVAGVRGSCCAMPIECVSSVNFCCKGRRVQSPSLLLGRVGREQLVPVMPLSDGRSSARPLSRRRRALIRIHSIQCCLEALKRRRHCERWTVKKRVGYVSLGLTLRRLIGRRRENAVHRCVHRRHDSQRGLLVVHLVLVQLSARVLNQIGHVLWAAAAAESESVAGGGGCRATSSAGAGVRGLLGTRIGGEFGRTPVRPIHRCVRLHGSRITTTLSRVRLVRSNCVPQPAEFGLG